MFPVTISNSDEFRPKQWEDYIGQTRVKERLRVHIAAALHNRRRLEHVLLVGHAGYGKTALCHLIAQELGEKFVDVTAPITDRTLHRIVRQHRGVLLIDEIHRTPVAQQEHLYTLLDQGYLQTSQGVRLENPWLTIIGATTEPHKLTKPLKSRFPIAPEFVDYSLEEMVEIVRAMARTAKINFPEHELRDLARAAGGVPRSGRTLMIAARDLSVDLQRTPTPTEVLHLCQLDRDGLTGTHLRYLKVLNMLGGQAGLRPIASMLQLKEDAVIELEKILADLGLIILGERGRELTANGSTKVDQMAN